MTALIGTQSDFTGDPIRLSRRIDRKLFGLGDPPSCPLLEPSKTGMTVTRIWNVTVVVICCLRDSEIQTCPHLYWVSDIPLAVVHVLFT